MQGVISMYGGGTDVFLDITQANSGSEPARESDGAANVNVV